MPLNGDWIFFLHSYLFIFISGGGKDDLGSRLAAAVGGEGPQRAVRMLSARRSRKAGSASCVQKQPFRMSKILKEVLVGERRK